MNSIELLILSVGLSMDAFAVAVCTGLTLARVGVAKALIVGLYFGIFQGLMPLLGFSLSSRFAERIAAFDHWVAFVLLTLIGGKMILDSFHQEGCPDRVCPEETCTDRTCPYGCKPEQKEASLGPAAMLPLAVATSIDALAVGVSFVFLQVDILPAVATIGVTTLLLSSAGVKLGQLFGARLRSKAELTGGLILAGMGLRILLTHLAILPS